MKMSKSFSLMATVALLIATNTQSVVLASPVSPESRSASSRGDVLASSSSIFRTPGSLPTSRPAIRFEANLGQAKPQFKFLHRGPRYSVAFGQAGALFRLASDAGAGPRIEERGGEVLVRPVGANSRARIVGKGPAPGTTNYLFGNDESNWVSGIRSYGRVVYREIYQGIDMVYYGNSRGELEYDFVVSPHRDPSHIALQYRGARSVRIDRTGNLVVDAGQGVLRQSKPVVYQKVGGTKVRVAGRFVKTGKLTVGFHIGAYDKTKPLVIDPVVKYSTHLGGGGDDSAADIALDAKGDIYVTGRTVSVDFPTRRPADAGCGTDSKCDEVSDESSLIPGASAGTIVSSDVFVTKLSKDASQVIYSTYIGGSRNDEATSLAVDFAGAAYVVGRTDSINFPTSDNAIDRKCGTDASANCDQHIRRSGHEPFLSGNPRRALGNPPPGTIETKADLFLAKLTPAGDRLMYSTYLGGEGEDGSPGSFSYTPGPTGEPEDLILNSNVSVSAEVRWAAAVAVDNAGNAYVTGATSSKDFPITPNAPDNQCGTDGSCNKREYDTPRAYATGQQVTNSPVPQVRFHSDGFLSRIDTTAADSRIALSYSTFLGGGRADAGQDIALWSDPNSGKQYAYLTGFTDSPKDKKFPITDNAYQREPTQVPPITFGNGIPCGEGCNADRAGLYAIRETEAFFARADLGISGVPAGGKLFDYATLLGGGPGQQGKRQTSGYERSFAVAVDPDGNGYVAGYTSSADFDIKGTAGNKPLQESMSADPELKNSSSYLEVETFVSKFDPRADEEASLVYSTYLGGSSRNNGPDTAFAIQVETNGAAWVAGYTASRMFPEKEPFEMPGSQNCRDGNCRDAFIAAIDPLGSQLKFSSFLGGGRWLDGGSPVDVATGIGLWKDPGSGNLFTYLAGRTGATDFPVAFPFQRSNGGRTDAFVTVIGGPAPLVTMLGIDPAAVSGPSSGGVSVKVKGRGLNWVDEVNFGERSVPCPSESCSSNAEGTVLSVVTPPHREGFVDITLGYGSDTTPANRDARFRYYAGLWETNQEPLLARSGQTATVLQGPDCKKPELERKYCGKVLYVGGVSPTASLDARRSVELFDPKTGTWSSRACLSGPPSGSCPGPTIDARTNGHSAVSLPDGSVLIIGGVGGSNGTTTLKTIERYDPATGAWSAVGSLQLERRFQTATFVTGSSCGSACNQILVVGGRSGRLSGNAESGDPSPRSAELFNTQTGQSSIIAGPNEGRWRLHTATALPNGTILVVGGERRATPKAKSGAYQAGEGEVSESVVELFDPSADDGRGAWKVVAKSIPRMAHTATPLPDGKVLITGGVIVTDPTIVGSPTGSSQIYDPAAGDPASALRFTASLETPRSGHAAVLLPGGRVLVAGGATVLHTSRPPLPSAEIFDPGLDGGKGGWIPAASMDKARGQGKLPGGHSTVLLGNVSGQDDESCGSFCGKVLAFGGASATPADANAPPEPAASGYLSSAEIFTPPPSIAAIDPGKSDRKGGAVVTITGTGFQTGARVLMGESYAAPCNKCAPDSPTRLARIVPSAGKDPVIDVGVITPGVGMGSKFDAFSYTGAPQTIVDLVAQATSVRDVKLTFAAAATVGGIGPPAKNYVVKQSRSPIASSNFDAASSLCDDGVCKYTPERAGSTLSLEVAGVSPDTRYYFAAKAVDEEGVAGPMSNVAEVVTGVVLPGTINDLSAEPVSSGEVRLTFSAPGSDELSPPPASSFIVKQSATAGLQDPEKFQAAAALCGGVCNFRPARVGDKITLSVTGLSPGTSYQFAVRATDEAGNLGQISNPVLVTTPPGTAVKGVKVEVPAKDDATPLSRKPAGTVADQKPSTLPLVAPPALSNASNDKDVQASPGRAKLLPPDVAESQGLHRGVVLGLGMLLMIAFMIFGSFLNGRIRA